MIDFLNMVFPFPVSSEFFSIRKRVMRLSCTSFCATSFEEEIAIAAQRNDIIFRYHQLTRKEVCHYQMNQSHFALRFLGTLTV